MISIHNEIKMRLSSKDKRIFYTLYKTTIFGKISKQAQWPSQPKLL